MDDDSGDSEEDDGEEDWLKQGICSETESMKMNENESRNIRSRSLRSLNSTQPRVCNTL